MFKSKAGVETTRGRTNDVSELGRGKDRGAL